ncbi:MAG TPA: transglycosylase domain-containing protein, partial [Thermoanaerobaculia bacterium]|nr:transglycosylase domain-containing protein [Thermoanaerobaculia bacterium]
MSQPIEPIRPLQAVSLPTEAGPGVPAAAPELRSRRRWGRPLLTTVIFLAGAWLAWEAVTWPNVAALARENPRTTAFIEEYRGSGWFAPRRPIEQRWVPYGRISSNLKVAVLVGEDDDFFSHHGFAREEMRSALEEAWKEKRLPRGASTITQQLAKNLWLSSSRNPLRKLKEAALTRQLEAKLKKRRIFEIYLNVAELGPGIYGAEAA